MEAGINETPRISAVAFLSDFTGECNNSDVGISNAAQLNNTLNYSIRVI